MSWIVALPAIAAILLGGAYVIALLDAAFLRNAAGATITADLARLPLRRAAGTLHRQQLTTEAPDAAGRLMAPALYLSLAAVALALVPAAEGHVLLETSVGIVVWGAVEALTVVAVFLHGWSQNALFPLLGGYRFVALGLSAMLLSMFVLIGAALPAQSLSLTDVVASQSTLWNVLRQPLGLPAFMLLGLTISLREPMNFGDSADLAGGTCAEDSGVLHGAWQLARSAMLVSFSAIAATAFLGGYLGPWLPGPAWLAIKTLVVLAVMVAVSHVLARPDASRALTLLWTILLPLAFLNLAVAGLVSLP